MCVWIEDFREKLCLGPPGISGIFLMSTRLSTRERLGLMLRPTLGLRPLG